MNCLSQHFYVNPESKGFVRRDGIEIFEGQINSLCLQIKLDLWPFFPYHLCTKAEAMSSTVLSLLPQIHLSNGSTGN